MIKTTITNSAKQDFLQGVHQAGDAYKIALYVEGADLDADTKEYSGEKEAEGKGYVVGGKILTGYSVSFQAGKAILTFDTVTWEDASIEARAALIYNSTRNNKAVAVFDFKETVTSTNDKFTVSMPSPTANLGLIRLA